MGQGSAFSLRFPDVSVSARLAPAENPGTGEAIDFNLLRPSTLLVVDDHEANCELVAGMFVGTHHRMCTPATEPMPSSRPVRCGRTSSFSTSACRAWTGGRPSRESAKSPVSNSPQ